MKTKNIVFRLLKRIVSDLVISVSLLLIAMPNYSVHGELAGAEGFDNANIDSQMSFPYEKTFTISAYYSPLPCQSRYATGSYEADIRLNGSGVRGADGTPVYPGMIAAPRTYPFGTKMDIPGVGIVSVHDRGGAIVASNTEGFYDRLDVWMGYGDVGLKRALNWGKRSMNVMVYGLNDSLPDQIGLAGYSSEESSANSCGLVSDEATLITTSVVSTNSDAVSDGTVAEIEPVDPDVTLTSDLNPGDQGENVRKVQEELKNLNYFKTDITGFFGPVTEHAVFKFQQSQLLVGDENSPGAGIFGAKTRDRLNEIIVSRDFNNFKVALASDEYRKRVVAEQQKIIVTELSLGTSGEDVKNLQRFLKTRGYFEGTLITDYFGPVTQAAVIKFQKDNNLITSDYDLGAGRVGPSTLELINNLG